MKYAKPLFKKLQVELQMDFKPPTPPMIKEKFLLYTPTGTVGPQLLKSFKAQLVLFISKVAAVTQVVNAKDAKDVVEGVIDATTAVFMDGAGGSVS